MARAFTAMPTQRDGHRCTASGEEEHSQRDPHPGNFRVNSFVAPVMATAANASDDVTARLCSVALLPSSSTRHEHVKGLLHPAESESGPKAGEGKFSDGFRASDGRRIVSWDGYPVGGV